MCSGQFMLTSINFRDQCNCLLVRDQIKDEANAAYRVVPKDLIVRMRF